jgi:hypothetical protein
VNKLPIAVRMSRWLAIAVLVCVGCDDVPSYRAPKNLTPSNSSLVSPDGRDSYEWTWNPNGYFEAIRPSIYAFLEESDPRFNIQSLFGQEDQSAWKRPDWMSDEIYNFFRLFTSCPPPQVILEVPLTEKVDREQFFLDPRARKLYWCVGDLIQSQDLATDAQGDSSPSTPASIRSPLGAPQAILGDRDNESVFIRTEKAIARIRLRDASVLWEAQLPSPAVRWVRATDVNTIALVTADSKCVICDGESGKLTICPAQVSSPHISLNPQGNWLLGNQKQQILLWDFQDGSDSVSKHTVVGVDPEKGIPFAGPAWDGWIDHQHFAFREHGKYKAQLFSYSHFLQEPRLFRSELSVRESFYTLIGKGLAGSIYSDKVLVTDLDVIEGGVLHSQPTVLEEAQAMDVQISKTGGVLAWATPKSLRVLSRIPQASSRMTYGLTQITMELIDKMDWQQLEKVAVELRSHDWPSDYVSGETAYGSLAQSCAAIIAGQQQLANPDEPLDEQPLPKPISEWLESKRAFPRFVAACLEQVLSKQARGTSMINLVPEENLKRHEKHEERKLALLQEILSEQDPPGQAYEMMLWHLRSMGGGYQKGEDFTRQCMHKYPQFWGLHETNLWWMLPRWGGSAGQAQAYAEGVTKLYPQKFQDRVFGILVNRMIRYNQSEFMKESEGFLQPKRLLDGVFQWCKDGDVPQMMVENAAEVAMKVNAANTKYFIDYNVKHFPVMRRIGDVPRMQRAFDQAKQALLPSQDPSKGGPKSQ